jgi:hypothetical protein
MIVEVAERNVSISSTIIRGFIAVVFNIHRTYLKIRSLRVEKEEEKDLSGRL